MSNYEVKNNTIISRGKFVGQPRWAPHFWTQGQQGLADEHIHHGYIFDITQKDIDKFLPAQICYLERECENSTHFLFLRTQSALPVPDR